MKEKLFLVLITISLLGLASSSPAQIGSKEDYCRNYANKTIEQVNERIKLEGSVPANDAVWSADWKLHYSWCMSGTTLAQCEAGIKKRQDWLDSERLQAGAAGQRPQVLPDPIPRPVRRPGVLPDPIPRPEEDREVLPDPIPRPAEEDFCRHYADAAIKQVNDRIRLTGSVPKNDKLWSTEWEDHHNWCMRVARDLSEARKKRQDWLSSHERPSPDPGMPQGSADFKTENNTDRAGMDYTSLWLEEPNPDLCQQACANAPKCKAYTYVKPGIQGPKARCWLKKAVPPARSNLCCVSGVKLASPAKTTPPPITGGGTYESNWLKSYCKEYADTALMQVQEMIDRTGSIPSSHPALWSKNWNNHYNWCMKNHRNCDGETKKRKDWLNSLPLTPNDVVAIAFETPDYDDNFNMKNELPKLIAWYRDGTFSRGDFLDFDRYTQRNGYALPKGKTPGDIVGMVSLARIGDKPYVITLFRDGSGCKGYPYSPCEQSILRLDDEHTGVLSHLQNVPLLYKDVVGLAGRVNPPLASDSTPSFAYYTYHKIGHVFTTYDSKWPKDPRFDTEWLKGDMYSLAAGYTPQDIVGMAMVQRDGTIVTYYRDGKASIGTWNQLSRDGKLYSYSIAK
jgi:hypothetical protein